MRELSVTEQRYKAVLAVISDGRTVTEVARDWNVCRQTLHEWLGRYEEEGIQGLAKRSHRPDRCPHQIPAEVEAQVLGIGLPLGYSIKRKFRRVALRVGRSRADDRSLGDSGKHERELTCRIWLRRSNKSLTLTVTGVVGTRIR